MPVNNGGVDSITVHPPNEILDSSEDKQSIITCSNLDESREHDVSQKKPKSKEHKQYASIQNRSKTVGCWQSIGFDLKVQIRQMARQWLSIVEET